MIADRSHRFVDPLAHCSRDGHEEARTEAIKSVTGTSKYNIRKQRDHDVAAEENAPLIQLPEGAPLSLMRSCPRSHLRRALATQS